METHVIGFPRIGPNRELKKALESYWKGQTTEHQLKEIKNKLISENHKTQAEAGLSLITAGDFSLYDHILDMAFNLGLIPERFQKTGLQDTELYFALARGYKRENTPAQAMLKWFDTNYHYIVPEFEKKSVIKLKEKTHIEEQTELAKSNGYRVKAAIPGPITFISLSTETDICKWDFADDIIEAYQELLSRLAGKAELVQLEEPILATELTRQQKNIFQKAYDILTKAENRPPIMLTSYFGLREENTEIFFSSETEYLHIDLCRTDYRRLLSKNIPDNTKLSVGIIDGRNIWKTDLNQALGIIQKIENKLGRNRLLLSSSCSLIHVPVSLRTEHLLETYLKNSLSFAEEKCREISLLASMLEGKEDKNIIKEHQSHIKERLQHPASRIESVRKRIKELTEDMFSRTKPFEERKKIQQEYLNLPLYPTTTIGSFPQTKEIRKQRQLYKKGEISKQEYIQFIKQQINRIIKEQEQIGLDVLVHGEPERNDMVEYFAELLPGYCTTQNGWVQSYGSRCVKPPIIHGDIYRSRSLSGEWIKYAQSLTKKPVKAMLTGPVTMLKWSFVRDDLSMEEVAYQIALALRDETKEIEKEGSTIIQIDEPAIREGLPLEKAEREKYLKWAIKAFRLASSGVKDSTQIHTHMCYSDFAEIINWIAEMDADVISIEASRSKMELLKTFEEYQYPNDIGPGVYDVHSPRIPTTEEIKKLIERAAKYIKKEKLWINPDCGLKTRDWAEVIPALKNMVTAAQEMRKQ
ncbi:5-methyltetrahydropteroyltriglutamate--homocysteine S-methyltransferase [Spirochaetia bacterium 38H-sp]|uniref:5-methyltetrahydropteroyltriglutamate--homocysteine methyltransferase n=1 Tax=Rarispira pelagica TaxID=3141764 RepID=A0ABU9UCJ0_9SPIR